MITFQYCKIIDARGALIILVNVILFWYVSLVFLVSMKV